MDNILSKIKNLDLNILNSTTNLFDGKYKSIFKGNGINFSEYKKFEYGDDTRYIDWKLSLKKGNLYKKSFIEERNINILLVIDISSSMFFLNKQKIFSDFSFLISHLAFKNSDNLSLITFNNEIINYIKPKNTRNNFLNIINNISNLKYEYKLKTNIKNTINFINKMIKKRTIIFFISDFISDIDYENEIRICKIKHDFIPIIIDIKEEYNIINNGLIEAYNPENNKYIIIDTSLNNEFYNAYKKDKNNLLEIFKKNSIDFLSINENNLLLELNKFFSIRKRKY